MNDNFSNPKTHTQSWYVACSSSEIKCGRAHTVSLLGRKIVVYRTNAGVVNVLDARCPHLGADLGLGQVTEDGIQCAFHHWKFGSNGVCSYAPGLSTVPARRTRRYPSQEKWGYVWIWNGPEILFDLPKIAKGFKVMRMPSQTLQCHPHIMIANGLDLEHFSALHGMALEKSSLKCDLPYSVEVSLTGRPISRVMQMFVGTYRRPIDASFKTFGGNMAVASVRSPVKFEMLFTGNLTSSGHCNTHTIAFLPRNIVNFLRALASMYVLLHDDRKILEGIDFSPAFTERDQALKQFAETVNSMETW